MSDPYLAAVAQAHDRARRLVASGCSPILRGLSARDGLLWRGETEVDLPEADRCARAAGLQHAEELVRALAT